MEFLTKLNRVPKKRWKFQSNTQKHVYWKSYPINGSIQALSGTVRAPVFDRYQFFGTSEHYGKTHGSLLSGWMNYNYTACCWFPTSSNILILPSQFWQIRFESCWLRCSKCRILVLLRYPIMQRLLLAYSNGTNCLEEETSVPWEEQDWHCKEDKWILRKRIHNSYSPQIPRKIALQSPTPISLQWRLINHFKDVVSQ